MKLYVYGKRISLQRFIKQVAFFFIYPFFFLVWKKQRIFPKASFNSCKYNYYSCRYLIGKMVLVVRQLFCFQRGFLNFIR